MARASTYTLLPLDTWARILGISPWEFNQIAYPGTKSAQCKDVFYQQQWQKDHLGREEVAQAIADAEQMVAQELRYWPAPRYFVDEVIPYPRPHQRNLFGFAGTPRGEWKTFPLNWHRYISGGLFNRTFLNNTTAIALSDPDGDGIKERFTATLTVPAGTNPAEIALYFKDSDRDSEPLSEIWRIRPVRVTVSATTATIVGHTTLLVKPNLTLGINAAELKATEDSNYVTELEGYRAFTDASATDALPYQGVAMWKNDPTCTQDCTFSLIPLCLGQDDIEQGQVFASFGLPSTWPFRTREPDRLQVNYVAGLALENGQMQPEMARIVTYLSVSLLANEKCGCDRTNRILERWKARITRFQDDANKATAFADSKNAFPMTVGAQWSWERVRKWKDVEAVSI